MHVGALWGVGDVPGGEADVEVADQDDGLRDEVEVFLECSAEEGGCAAGSHRCSRGLLRARVGG